LREHDPRLDTHSLIKQAPHAFALAFRENELVCETSRSTLRVSARHRALAFAVVDPLPATLELTRALSHAGDAERARRESATSVATASAARSNEAGVSCGEDTRSHEARYAASERTTMR
jgi:hypothetical protein